MSKIKLYQILEKAEMNNFLKAHNSSIEKEALVEIKENNLFVDFIVIAGYKFKLTNGVFQCMETPKDKHRAQKINIIKNPHDSINYKK